MPGGGGPGPPRPGQRPGRAAALGVDALALQRPRASLALRDRLQVLYADDLSLKTKIPFVHSTPRVRACLTQQLIRLATRSRNLPPRFTTFAASSTMRGTGMTKHSVVNINGMTD